MRWDVCRMSSNEQIQLSAERYPSNENLKTESAGLTKRVDNGSTCNIRLAGGNNKLDVYQAIEFYQ
jgi:hypothetical protein